MNGFDDVWAAADVAPPDQARVGPTVLVDPGANQTLLIDAIIEVFSGDDDIDVVRLVTDNTQRFLGRSATYDFVPDATKGYGDGAGAQLPGLPSGWRVARLSCSIDGAVVFTTLPEPWPDCPDHPGTQLQPAT